MSKEAVQSLVMKLKLSSLHGDPGRNRCHLADLRPSYSSCSATVVSFITQTGNVKLEMKADRSVQLLDNLLSTPYQMGSKELVPQNGLRCTVQVWQELGLIPFSDSLLPSSPTR